MFLVPKKILEKKDAYKLENFGSEYFFLMGGKILNIKKIFIDCQLKIKNNNLKCVHTFNQLLILPKTILKIIKKYINLKKCNIRISYNNLIAIDKQKFVIYRISFNSIGENNLLNNYKFLEQNNIIKAPKPIAMRQNGIIITSEEMIKGTNISFESINRKSLINIINEFNKLYSKNKKNIIFDIKKELSIYENLIKNYPEKWKEKLEKIKKIIIQKNDFGSKKNIKAVKTYIHGDLTFKNILLNKNNFYFIDFDRSGINFAEFDIWLFKLHYLTYKYDYSYKGFLNYILNFINNKIIIEELEYFYNLNENFAINKKMSYILKYLFLYRMLALSLQNFNKNDILPINLLEYTIVNL